MKDDTYSDHCIFRGGHRMLSELRRESCAVERCRRRFLSRANPTVTLDSIRVLVWVLQVEGTCVQSHRDKRTFKEVKPESWRVVCRIWHRTRADPWVDDCTPSHAQRVWCLAYIVLEKQGNHDSKGRELLQAYLVKHVVQSRCKFMPAKFENPALFTSLQAPILRSLECSPGRSLENVKQRDDRNTFVF